MLWAVISDLVLIFGDLDFKEQNITEDEVDFFEDEVLKLGGSVCYF